MVISYADMTYPAYIQLNGTAMISFATLRSFAGHITPEVFVQLDLHPHRQLVLQHPVGQLGGVLLSIAGCEQHLAAFVQFMLINDIQRPLVIKPAADHELHLVVFVQVDNVGIQVAFHLTGTGCFQVHDPADTRINLWNIERATGLQRHLVICITQILQQTQAGHLRQRFTARYRYIRRPEGRNLRQYFIRLHPFPALEGVAGIAVAAA